MEDKLEFKELHDKDMAPATQGTFAKHFARIPVCKSFFSFFLTEMGMGV